MPRPDGSLLGSLPHRVDIYAQQRLRDKLGGHDRVWVRRATAISCFVQNMTHREEDNFEKRGQVATTRIYFSTDPGVDESEMLRYVDEAAVVHCFEIFRTINRGANVEGPYMIVGNEISDDIDPEKIAA